MTPIDIALTVVGSIRGEDLDYFMPILEHLHNLIHKGIVEDCSVQRFAKCYKALSPHEIAERKAK